MFCVCVCVTALFISNSLHTQMQLNFILHTSYNMNETIFFLSLVQTKNNGKAILHIQNFV